MALNTFKCNHLMLLQFKGLRMTSSVVGRRLSDHNVSRAAGAEYHGQHSQKLLTCQSRPSGVTGRPSAALSASDTTQSMAVSIEWYRL